jgi:hypothetical protein
MRFFKLFNFILFEFLIASLLKNLLLQFMQNDDSEVGRGSQETQIKQQRRYSEEDGGRQIFGVDGESNEQRTNNKKTKRPGGIDRGDIRIVRRKRSNDFGLIKDSEEFGGIFKDDYEFIPNNAEGDERAEMWLYGEGKSSSAAEGDRKSSNNHCKRTHRGEGTSMEDSLVEGDQQNIDCQGGFTSETFDHSRKRPTFLLTETGERHSISSEPKFRCTSAQENTTPVPDVSSSISSENQKGYSDSRGSVHISPTETSPTSGRRNSQYVPGNKTQHHSSAMHLNVNQENNRSQGEDQTFKHICHLENILSDTNQEGRLNLISEAIDTQHVMVSGSTEREFSNEGYHQDGTAIPKGIFQGACSSSDKRPASLYYSSSTSSSSRYSKSNVQEQNFNEQMLVQNTEGLYCLSASSNGDRQFQHLMDHIHSVESPTAPYTCKICNKTMQNRNYNNHKNSGIHKARLQEIIDRDNIADIRPVQTESVIAAPVVKDKSLVLKIFSRSDITTLQTIPNNLRRNIATALSALYRNSNSNILHIEAHVELLIFHKIVLANMSSLESKNISNKKRKKVQTRYTKDRLDKWLSGGDVRDELILSVLKSPIAQYFRHPQSPASNMKRCVKLVTQHGQYSKAIKALSSEGIVEPSTATTSKLQEKHPLGQLPAPIDLTGVESIQVNMEDISKALRSFPKDTACGRSGLRVTHLMETLYLGTNFDQALSTMYCVLYCCFKKQKINSQYNTCLS